MRLLRSLQMRLWLSFALVLILTLFLLALALTAQAEHVRSVLLYQRLRERVRTLAPLINVRLQESPGFAPLDRLLRRPLARAPLGRLLILDPDGRVLSDTGGPPLDPEARVWRWRAEAREYRGEIYGQDGQRWLVVGLPLSPRGSPNRPQAPVLAAAGPLQDANLLTPVLQPLLISGVFALLAGLLVAALVTRWITRPMDALRRATQAIAQGNLDVQLDPSRVPAEFVPLVENFNAMARQVKATRQAQRNFVANVSHDLKTPLTSIRGFAQALKEGVAADPGAQCHAASVIYEEAERMNRLVAQLLELAKMDAGQLVLEKRPLDLNALLTRLVENARLRAEEADIRLETALSPTPPVTGDPDWLARVFTNLLENALTFTPRGGTITVTTAVEHNGSQQPERVVVSVTDTGPGIPEEDLPHIFERFYRADKSRAKGHSSGLGLAIVKELVEAHGGKVSVQSVPGLGTRFTVRLPVNRSSD